MNENTAFDIPNIKPLTELISLLVDKQDMCGAIEMTGKARGDVNLNYFLVELAESAVMLDELSEMANKSVMAEKVINRREVFGDTLEVVMGVAEYTCGGRTPKNKNPLAKLPLKVSRVVENAIIGNLALYGLLALLAEQAEAEIEINMGLTAAAGDGA